MISNLLYSRVMKLIFEETKNRSQCAAEVTVNDLNIQCTFSTAKVVHIPEGFAYSGGKLERCQTAHAVIAAICSNHEMRLKNAAAELSLTEPQ